MSKDQKPHNAEPTMIDEAYMERFPNDQLAFQAWEGVDLACTVLFADSIDSDELSDAKFEVGHAALALRVLVRRLTGMDADQLRAAVKQRRLELLVLEPETDQLPAWETIQ